MNLNEYVEASKAEGNLWWRLSPGTQLNLLDEAIEENELYGSMKEGVAQRIGDLEREIDRLTLALSKSETECGHLTADLAEAREDSERLREQVQAGPAVCQECDALREEIDRLGTELANVRESISQWRIKITSPTADDPFRKIECGVVDVGYADKVIVVEAAAVGGEDE